MGINEYADSKSREINKESSHCRIDYWRRFTGDDVQTEIRIATRIYWDFPITEGQSKGDSEMGMAMEHCTVDRETYID